MSEKKQLVTIQDILDCIYKSHGCNVSIYVESRNEGNAEGKILQFHHDAKDGKMYVNFYSLENVNTSDERIVQNILYDVIPYILTWCSLEPVYYDYKQVY